MKRYFLFAIGALAILAAVVALAERSSPHGALQSEHTYVNQQYGVSFTYPAFLTLAEGALNGGGARYAVTLVDHGNGKNIPDDADGPPGITLQIFYDDSGNSLVDWVRATKDANFALSTNSNINTTSLSGRDAVRYVWDGLYRGESVVVRRGSYVYMFSVTYRSYDDPLRVQFRDILSTVAFN